VTELNCAVCLRPVVDPDCHHICGRHNIEDATIGVHRHSCHRRLTEAQRAAGILMDKRAERDEIDLMWSIMAGFGVWLSLMNGSGGFDRNMWLAGQLLASLRTPDGREFGPDPGRTDVRASKYRGGPAKPEWTEAKAAEFVERFTSELADALETLDPRIAIAARAASAIPEQLAQRCTGMGDQQARTDAATLDRAVRALVELTRGRATVEETVSAMAPLREVFDRWIPGVGE